MALRLTRRARPAAHEAHGAIARVARWLADVPRDCRLAQRQMRRLPGVTALVVLTLALGIGANVTLVGAVEHLLLRPPDHVREPARVVRLLAVSRDGQNATTVVGANYPTLLDLQRASTAFESVAGFATRRLSLGTGTEAVEVRATLVSSDFFAVLGASPALGRTFSADDNYPTGTATGGSPFAVLSQRFWRRYYGADSSVLGRGVRIGDVGYTVVGVMPA